MFKTKLAKIVVTCLVYDLVSALTQIFDDQVYYMVRFSLSDFILYIGADYKSHYQRKKAKKHYRFSRI